uniref:Uncharacterized protein n=1 Tax=Medicago truncatula TaxID=3880 RepID=I3SIS8_MEDTR|nr:unknown [Medicago truncatula]
MRGITNNTINY